MEKAVLRIGLGLLFVGLSWTSQVSAQSQVPQSQQQIKLSFAPVVKAAAPAVVNIYTRKVIKTQATHPLLNDPFFQQFFGQDMRLGPPQEKVQNSLGSGIIIRPDGIVVTNHHVIKGADAITVVLSDKREFHAKVVGSDPRTDLAVLKMDNGAARLPALVLGDSDSLEVGDMVLAIGNPYGVGQTVTSGIVSANARTTVGVTDFRFFIQTDAAINLGNSGGALVDLNGQLMGVNTAIYSKTGGNIGLGFAIPANMVRAVVSGILATGHPVRPWFGAGGQGVTAEIASTLGFPRPTGVLINDIYPGGPADKAGLKVGDVVLAVNDREVGDVEGLRYRIATQPVGGTAAVKVVREGKGVDLTVKLIAPPDQPPRDLSRIEGRTPFSVTEVANLNPALVEEMGLHTFGSGVILVGVQRGSIADQLGFQPGDIILSVNGTDTKTVASLKEVLSTNPSAYAITIKRGDKVLTVKARR